MGRPRIYASNAQRQAAYRERKKLRELEEMLQRTREEKLGED